MVFLHSTCPHCQLGRRVLDDFRGGQAETKSGPGSPGTRNTEHPSLGSAAPGTQELPEVRSPGKAWLMLPRFLA